ncbi:MAG: polysaccharide deacetylase, partial [Telluria sp.]
MISRPVRIGAAVAAAGAIGAALLFAARAPTPPAAVIVPVTQAPAPAAPAKAAAFERSAKELLANYRKIIVLLADEAKLTEKERAHTSAVGQELFHQNQANGMALENELAALVASSQPGRHDALHRLLDY